MEWEYLIKILIAAILGGIIGAEREYTGKAAGLRTFIIVTLGSCLFTIISINIINDPARIAAQIVSGIGFIGAGLIIFQQEKQTIKGLTTAAGLWMVAAIGMAVGFGFYILAALSTLIAILILMGLRGPERFLDKRAYIAYQKRIQKENKEKMDSNATQNF
jgi:putative Mg2+ transporter-C (MgtC) family protein